MLLFCIQSSLQMDKRSKPVGHEWFCYSSDSLSLLLLLNIKHSKTIQHIYHDFTTLFMV